MLSVLDIQVLCLYFNTVHKFSLIFSWYYQSNNAWTTPPHLLNTCELKVVRNQAGAVPCASFSLTIVDGRGFRCSFHHKVSDIFFNRSREHT